MDLLGVERVLGARLGVGREEDLLGETRVLGVLLGETRVLGVLLELGEKRVLGVLSAIGPSADSSVRASQRFEVR